MKILITGGNGYIAKSIHSYLHSKYDITTVGRQDFDLTDWEQTSKWFQGKYFDVVIHTAAVGGHRLDEDTDQVIRENILMYTNLISNQSKFTKFIHFGSGAELNHPTSPYGISKQIIADSMFSKENFLNLRIFAVFDKNELFSRFIKSNIQRYINHEDMVIYGDRSMDFFYMEDLISLLDYFLSREEWLYEEIDCVYMNKYTLTDIAEIINNLDSYKVNIKLGITQEKPYVGIWRGLPIKLIGLERGIKKTYNELKNG
jgi:nucleoside-diphosphate-sugar epimerase